MAHANIWRTACLAMVVLVAPAQAQTDEGYVLELNNAFTVDAGCRLIYMVENNLDQAIDASSFQMAMFNAGGKITSLSVLQFGGVRAGGTKVVQFDLPSPPCEDLSRILVNELDTCQADGADSDICLSELVTRNMTEIRFE